MINITHSLNFEGQDASNLIVECGLYPVQGLGYWWKLVVLLWTVNQNWCCDVSNISHSLNSEGQDASNLILECGLYPVQGLGHWQKLVVLLRAVSQKWPQKQLHKYGWCKNYRKAVADTHLVRGC